VWRKAPPQVKRCGFPPSLKKNPAGGGDNEGGCGVANRLVQPNTNRVDARPTRQTTAGGWQGTGWMQPTAVPRAGQAPRHPHASGTTGWQAAERTRCGHREASKGTAGRPPPPVPPTRQRVEGGGERQTRQAALLQRTRRARPAHRSSLKA